MECSFQSCFFYIGLGFAAAISLFLTMYVVGYIYFAYITQRYYSNDLIEQRESKLASTEQRYKQLLNSI
jgi:hypothetical protein